MRNFTKLLFTVIALLLLSSYGNAQQKKQEFTSVVGKLIRVTPKLADLDQTTMYGQPLKIVPISMALLAWTKRLKKKLREDCSAWERKLLIP